jgi:hypothetical protein
MIQTTLTAPEVQKLLDSLELHASTLRTRNADGDTGVAHDMERLRDHLMQDAEAAGYNVSYGIVNLAR